MANPYKNVSQEEFLQILKDFYDKHGRAPKVKEMKPSSGMPSSQAYYTKFRTYSWNKILIEAGLPLNHRMNYSKDDELATLRSLYDKFQRVPTREEYDACQCSPSHYYFYENYGTLENAYYYHNIIEKPLTDDDKVQKTIDAIIEFGHKHKRYPYVEELKQMKNIGYEYQTLLRRVNMDYLSLCRKYIPQYTPEEPEEITKDEIISEIKGLHNILGRPPLFKELKKHRFDFHFGVIQRCFDGLTYNQIIESLGWDPSYSTTISKTEEELLDDFLTLYNALKNIPTSYDLDKNISSYGTYVKRFGSIENVCKMLNIDYDIILNIGGVGCRCRDLNGGICKSTTERDITNYFIKNNIKYSKEPMYSELVDFGLRRFDWKITNNQNTFYVEFFGMYSKQTTSKIINKYRKNTRNKIKRLYKAGVIDQCILIFPLDMINKNLDEIFKPYLNTNNKNNKANS